MKRLLAFLLFSAPMFAQRPTPIIIGGSTSDGIPTTVQVNSSGVLVATSTGVIKPPPQAAGYTLRFDDEFTTLSLSPNGAGIYTWYNPTSLPMGAAVDWFPFPLPANFSSIPGQAILTTKVTDPFPATEMATISYDHTSYHAWQYGYFEARFKWDVTTGAWPVFWMMPVEDALGTNVYNGVRTAGEIDIFEGQGAHPTTYYGTLHLWENGTDVGQSSPNAFTVSTDFSQFHTYGLLWTPGQVTWYLDNVVVASSPTYSVFDLQHYYLILDMIIGVNFGVGNLTGVTASQIGMSVDYVRVWTP